jgi:hypothetical protein
MSTGALADAVVIATLEHVVELTFWDGNFDGRLLHSLMVPNADGSWPLARLERVKFVNVTFSQDDSSLPEYVRARNAAAVAGDSASTLAPTKLRKVEFSGKSVVPGWIRNEVALLLGEEPDIECERIDD